LSGVFDGTPSRASNAATRAVSICTCAHSVRISASFSSCDRRLRSGSSVTRSLNRNNPHHVKPLSAMPSGAQGFGDEQLLPHGMPTTEADTINADLLEFIQS
jgi:hypothetical protein